MAKLHRVPLRYNARLRRPIARGSFNPMFNHHLTFQCVARFLHADCVGAVIEEIFSQERDHIIMRIRSDAACFALEFILDSKHFCVLKKTEYHRAKKNSADLFAYLIGKRIHDVSLHPFDRILSITVDTGARLDIYFIPRRSTMVLINEAGEQLEQLRKQQNLPAELKSAMKFEVGELEKILTEWGSDHQSAVRMYFKPIGSTLLHELLSRTASPDQDGFEKLDSHSTAQRYLTTLDKMLVEARECRARIYHHMSVTPVFSIIQLNHLTDFREECFDDFFRALQSYIDVIRARERFHSLRDRMRSALSKERDRLSQKLDRLESKESLLERGKAMERDATLLFANPDAIATGGSVEVTDLFADTEAKVRIVIDPQKTIVEMAEKLFLKAKHVKRAASEIDQLRSRTETRLKKCRDALDRIDACVDYSSLKAIHLDEMKYLKPILENDQQQSGESRFPFRRFMLHGGYQVWAGKNSVNNDELTLRACGKNDLWFHARGAGGAHVVLKIERTKEVPSKETISAAASIAAYYSKQRKAKNVAVSYTFGKHVRKPKGAPHGTVVIERETVILVPPKLPEMIDESP